MPINYNGTAVNEIIYNGTSIKKVVYNGTTVFEIPRTQTVNIYPNYNAGSAYSSSQSGDYSGIKLTAKVTYDSYDDGSAVNTDTYEYNYNSYGFYQEEAYFTINDNGTTSTYPSIIANFNCEWQSDKLSISVVKGIDWDTHYEILVRRIELIVTKY